MIDAAQRKYAASTFTPAAQEAIARKVERGERQNQIAHDLGVPANIIHAICKKYGVSKYKKEQA